MKIYHLELIQLLGHKWEHRRKMFQPAFNSNIVKKIYVIYGYSDLEAF